MFNTLHYTPAVAGLRRFEEELVNYYDVLEQKHKDNGDIKMLLSEMIKGGAGPAEVDEFLKEHGVQEAMQTGGEGGNQSPTLARDDFFKYNIPNEVAALLKWANTSSQTNLDIVLKTKGYLLTFRERMIKDEANFIHDLEILDVISVQLNKKLVRSAAEIDEASERLSRHENRVHGISEEMMRINEGNIVKNIG